LLRAKDPSIYPEFSILKEIFLVQDTRPLYHFPEIPDRITTVAEENENGTQVIGTQKSTVSNEFDQATTVTGEEGDIVEGEDETYNPTNGIGESTPLKPAVVEEEVIEIRRMGPSNT